MAIASTALAALIAALASGGAVASQSRPRPFKGEVVPPAGSIFRPEVFGPILQAFRGTNLQRPQLNPPQFQGTPDAGMLEQLLPAMLPDTRLMKAEEIEAYHGTTHQFDEFAPYEKEIGIHFGTEKAAKDRVKLNTTGKYSSELPKDAIVKKVKLRINNPLRVKDTFGEGIDLFAKEIINREDLPDNHLRNKLFDKYDEYTKFERQGFGSEGYSKKLSELRKELNSLSLDYVKSAGYDGLVYKNTSEDIGKDSYVVFDKSQIISQPTQSGGVKAKELPKGMGGSYDPNTGEITIKGDMPKWAKETTKFHEQTHKLFDNNPELLKGIRKELGIKDEEKIITIMERSNHLGGSTGSYIADKLIFKK